MTINQGFPGWLAAEWPAPSWVHAGTTTRHGGISDAPYASFNLATHVNDNPAHVARNRAQLQQLLQLPAEPVWLAQVHGTTVVHAAETTQSNPQADASIASKPRIVCAVLTADCLPVLITDRHGRHIAAVHAGWRGLLAGIIGATIARLPVAPAELMVWLGPAIGPDAFEVGADVHDAFVLRDPHYARVFVDKGQQHWWMNAYDAARLELQQLGVTAVYGGEHCTYHDSRRFYSYRRDGVTGRMASLIWYDSPP